MWLQIKKNPAATIICSGAAFRETPLSSAHRIYLILLAMLSNFDPVDKGVVGWTKIFAKDYQASRIDQI